jgi:hypothetical protein
MSRVFAKFQFLAPAQKPPEKPTIQPGFSSYFFRVTPKSPSPDYCFYASPILSSRWLTAQQNNIHR